MPSKLTPKRAYKRTKHQVYQCWAKDCERTFPIAGLRTVHFNRKHASESRGQTKFDTKPKVVRVTCKLCHKRITKRNISKHIEGSCASVKKETKKFLHCPLRICRVPFTEKEKLDEHVKKAHLIPSKFRQITSSSVADINVSGYSDIHECSARNFLKDDFCIKVEVPDEDELKSESIFLDNSSKQVSVKDKFCIKIEVPDDLSNTNGFEGDNFLLKRKRLEDKEEFFANKRQKMCVPTMTKFVCHIKVCHASFDEKDDLVAHAKRVHKFLPKSRHFVDDCSTEKGFSCSVLDCGLVFETRRKFRNHVKKIHSDIESENYKRI